MSKRLFSLAALLSLFTIQLFTNGVPAATVDSMQTARSKPFQCNGLEFSVEAPVKWLPDDRREFQVKLKIKNLTSKAIIFSTQSAADIELKDSYGRLIKKVSKGVDGDIFITARTEYMQVKSGQTVERNQGVHVGTAPYGNGNFVWVKNENCEAFQFAPVNAGRYFLSIKLHSDRQEDLARELTRSKSGIAVHSRESYLKEHCANDFDIWQGDGVTNPIAIEIYDK